MNGQEKMDLSVSGSSTMPGGEYRTVRISGAGKVCGHLHCEQLQCSGAAKVKGDVRCDGSMTCSGSTAVAGSTTCGARLKCSGTFHCGGDASAPEISTSGAARIDGRLSGENIRASGSLTAGAVHCRDFHGSGSLRIAGDLEAETVCISGMAEIGGLLNAEEVTIAAGARTKIGDIGGSMIRIRQEPRHRLWFWGAEKAGGLTVGSIEGDTIELNDVRAEAVRGKRVRIGRGCRIGRVEYSETLEAEPGTVAEAVCLRPDSQSGCAGKSEPL